MKNVKKDFWWSKIQLSIIVVLICYQNVKGIDAFLLLIGEFLRTIYVSSWLSLVVEKFTKAVDFKSLFFIIYNPYLY